MRATGSEDLGKAVLRIVLGVLVLLHGIAKVLSGPGYAMQVAEQAGLPGVVGYGVYLGEVVGPVLIIIGLWTRLGALLIVLNMLFAIGLVHLHQLGMLNKMGGWELELQGMLLASAIAVMLLGAGRYSVGGAGGKLN
ncbi:DoxX family protein [Cupriavidus sp. AU9028]|uniref:DoxX family protein n=1 Tax=Cupriavidus sp. AU9028 TaxID=2871157 RepID=UPI001C978B78|nr:DoxX family protein [Cupriavidus sp. AU9028]MBY4897461.1 DoxX family protein [Cupriavidus sp. AU9028]